MRKNKLFKTLLSTAVMGLCLVSVTSCKDKDDKDKQNEVAEVKKYAITFDSQGGTDVAKIENIESGKTATKPADPTKDGFTFAGWFTDKTYQHEFNFKRDKIKLNWTLYAKWVANATA